jgi:hypothetical protein
MKRILFFCMLAFIATFTTITQSFADCTPPPKEQRINFIANNTGELIQLSSIYGVMSEDDVLQLVETDPAILTTMVIDLEAGTQQRIVTVESSTAYGNYVDIKWKAPILGQCGYPGPGTPTW